MPRARKKSNGNGNGHSVLDGINKTKKVSGRQIDYDFKDKTF